MGVCPDSSALSYVRGEAAASTLVSRLVKIGLDDPSTPEVWGRIPDWVEDRDVRVAQRIILRPTAVHRGEGQTDGVNRDGNQKL